MTRQTQAPFGHIHDEHTPLIAFEGYYRFQDHTYSILIWAHDWNEAKAYARRHNLTQVTQILETIP